jgi:hypothetical protein
MFLDASVTIAVSKPVMDIPSVEEVEFENLGTTIEVLANGTHNPYTHYHQTTY